MKIYRTTVFPVGFYVCQAQYLTLNKEDRLRVFESRVPRSILGLKGDEIVSWWRRLNNEDLYKFTPPPNIIRIMKSSRMRWAGHVSRMAKRNAYRFSVRSQEE
jgi:hypothetical protein